MQNALIGWIVPFVCGGIVSIIGMLLAKIRKNKTRDTSIEDGLQCLLRAEIIRSHDKYTDYGYCPVYAREALTRAYAAYHCLGGNDVATDLYKVVMALPPELNGCVRIRKGE